MKDKTWNQALLEDIDLGKIKRKNYKSKIHQLSL